MLPELGDAPPRVVAVLVDALGWTFLERLAERAPLLARLRSDGGVLSKLTTQFPSTTTAHVTTLHTAQPVGEHGAYEWFVYEPTLDRIVCPLTAGFAGEAPGGLVADGATCARCTRRTTDWRRASGERCHVHDIQPSHTIDSPFTQLVCAGGRCTAWRALVPGRPRGAAR